MTLELYIEIYLEYTNPLLSNGIGNGIGCGLSPPPIPPPVNLDYYPSVCLCLSASPSQPYVVLKQRRESVFCHPPQSGIKWYSVCFKHVLGSKPTSYFREASTPHLDLFLTCLISHLLSRYFSIYSRLTQNGPFPPLALQVHKVHTCLGRQWAATLARLLQRYRVKILRTYKYSVEALGTYRYSIMHVSVNDDKPYHVLQFLITQPNGYA